MRAASDRGQGGEVPQFSDFGSTVPQLPKAQGGIRAAQDPRIIQLALKFYFQAIGPNQ